MYIVKKVLQTWEVKKWLKVFPKYSSVYCWKRNLFGVLEVLVQVEEKLLHFQWMLTTEMFFYDLISNPPSSYEHHFLQVIIF